MRQAAVLLLIVALFLVFAGVVIARRISADRAESADTITLTARPSITDPHGLAAEDEQWVLELAQPLVPPEAPVHPGDEAATGLPPHSDDLVEQEEPIDEDAVLPAHDAEVLALTPAQLLELADPALAEARRIRLAAREAFVSAEGLTADERKLRLAGEALNALDGASELTAHFDNADPETIEQTALLLEDLGADRAAEVYLQAQEAWSTSSGIPVFSPEVLAAATRQLSSRLDALTRRCLKAGTCLVDFGLGEQQTLATFLVARALVDGGDELWVTACDALETACAIHAVRKDGGGMREVVKRRSSLEALTVTPEEVLWVEGPSVLAVPRGGGAIRAVITFAGGTPEGLAVHGEALWLSVTRVGPRSPREPSVITVVPLHGPAPSPLTAKASSTERLWGPVVRAREASGFEVLYGDAWSVHWFQTVAEARGFHELDNARLLWAEADDLFVQYGEAETTSLARVPRRTGESFVLTPVQEYSAFARLPDGFVAVREGPPLEVRLRRGRRALRTVAAFSGDLIALTADAQHAYLLLGSEDASARLIKVPLPGSTTTTATSTAAVKATR